AGIRAIVETLTTNSPTTKVLLLAILPRGADANDPWRRKCEAVNALLPALADGERVHFANVNAAFLAQDGTLSKELAPDLLHLSAKGYALWADAIAAHLTPLLKR
ncbi:MAG: GDSL family lipase, partial [Planctomycetes bacterium]|nr:GDSL family lipase [Planctomycetota bacterium]